jgi:hypothetical protein
MISSMLVALLGVGAAADTFVQQRHDDIWDEVLPPEIQLVAPLGRALHRTRMTFPAAIDEAPERQAAVSVDGSSRYGVSFDDFSFYGTARPFGRWVGLRLHSLDIQRASEASTRNATRYDREWLDSLAEQCLAWSVGAEGWLATSRRPHRWGGLAAWARVERSATERFERHTIAAPDVPFWQENSTRESREMDCGVRLPMRTTQGRIVIGSVSYQTAESRNEWHRLRYDTLHAGGQPQTSWDGGDGYRERAVTLEVALVQRTRKSGAWGVTVGGRYASITSYELHDEALVSETTVAGNGSGIHVSHFWGKSAAFGPLTISFGYALQGHMRDIPDLDTTSPDIREWDAWGRVPLLLDLSFAKCSFYSAMDVSFSARRSGKQGQASDTSYTNVWADMSVAPLMLQFRPSDKSRITFAPRFSSDGLWLWRFELSRGFTSRRDRTKANGLDGEDAEPGE